MSDKPKELCEICKTYPAGFGRGACDCASGDSPIESTKELANLTPFRKALNQLCVNMTEFGRQKFASLTEQVWYQDDVCVPALSEVLRLYEEAAQPRVGLSRGAEPEPLPPRGEAETPTDTLKINETERAHLIKKLRQNYPSQGCDVCDRLLAKLERRGSVFPHAQNLGANAD